MTVAVAEYENESLSYGRKENMKEWVLQFMYVLIAIPFVFETSFSEF